MRWAFDLRIFAIMAGIWAICLVMRAFVNVGDYEVFDPLRVVFGGVRFDGDAARIVLIVEAGIFASLAIGVFSEQRWGLLLRLWFIADGAMRHFAFALAYLPVPFDFMNVRATPVQVAR